MSSQLVKVKIEGQYYWQEGRVKQISNYDMEVEIPMTEVHRALWYIQRKLVNGLLLKRNERATGFRTCKIVSQLPAVPAQPITKEDSDLPISSDNGSTDDFPLGPQPVPEPDFPSDSDDTGTVDGFEDEEEDS